MCPWRHRRVWRPVLPELLSPTRTLAQLLALAVDDAHVDGELVAHNWAAAVALREFDALDLRRQLSTFNHRDMRCGEASAAS